MESIETLIQFFGWCSAINIGMLFVVFFGLVLFKAPIRRLHGSLFDLDDADLSQAYFQYLAQYKTAVLIFNIVPYFALRLSS